MAELDKKIQKAQTDLVQSVLEAQEKKNTERVEMLVTNAIKQLKMSRFKPDLATCLSLTNLARICPKIFNQSNAIKEVLKSLLRRDNGPANIKSKNDIVLPVLAANILLASCDSSDIRQIILNKIEQWLSGSNQKASDLIQHLLATICMKCQGDQQTISSLIEMRHHWLQYLEESLDHYGLAPVDLCAGVRRLLHSETNSESLLVYLRFLIKHDADIDGLSKEVARFVIDRPISLKSMVTEPEYGDDLNKMLLKIFNKLMSWSLVHRIHNVKAAQVKSKGAKQQDNSNKKEDQANVADFSKVIVKTEPTDQKDEKILPIQSDKKPNEQVPITATPLVDIKVVKNQEGSQVKSETVKNEQTNINSTKVGEEKSGSQDGGASDRLLYLCLAGKVKSCRDEFIILHQDIIEATLTLLAWFVDGDVEFRREFDELLGYYSIDSPSTSEKCYSFIIDDSETVDSIWHTPFHLIQSMALSANETIMEYAVYSADNCGLTYLVKLLHLFGLPLTGIDSILKLIERDLDGANGEDVMIEAIKNEVKDMPFFLALLELYTNLGSSHALKLHKRLKVVS